MKKNLLRRFSGSIIVASLILVLAGCADKNNPLGPYDPEISNKTDNFELQATGVQALTSTLDFTWRNTGVLANVNHSTTTTNGNAQLTIRDASGTVVYDKALVPSLNEPTASGNSGAWSIRLTLTNYSGTLNFRVQKP